MDNRPRGAKAERATAPAAPPTAQAPAPIAPPPARAFALLGGFDLRLGRWQEVLHQVGVVDSLIVDPPYGEGTHSGSISTRADRCATEGLSPDFEHWRPEDVTEFVHA
jgi:hypothetical protein